MLALRRLLVAFCVVLSGVAYALTPGERVVLFSGIKPVWQANFLSPVLVASQTLPSGLTYTKSGSIPATLFDSTGKLTYQGNNLSPYINYTGVGSGYWNINSTATVTQNNMAAPDGTLTAARIVVDGTAVNQGVYLNNVAVVGRTEIFSVYLKGAVGGEVVQIGDASSRTNVTLTTSWVRYNAPAHAALSTADIIYAQNNTAMTFYAVWPQLEAVTYQTSPSAFLPTTTTAVFAPRLDTNPATLSPAGLLVEEQRVQLLQKSGDLSASPWASYTAGSGTAAISANSVVAPDGTTSAAKVTINRTTAVSDYAEYYQNFTGTAASYTASYYVKADGVGDVGKTIAIALYNGSVVAATTQITLTSTWTRYTVTATLAASASCNTSIGYLAGVSSQTGTVNFDVWGGQAELGAFSTSYIPNPTSSTVTRTADVVTFSGVPLAAFKSATGSFVAQTQLRANDTSTYQAVLAANDGTNFPAPAYWYTSPKHANAYNGTNFLSAANTLDLTSPQRIATSWSANGRSLVASGGTVASDGYSAFGGYNITVANLGGNNFGTSNIINGWVQSLAIYNARLPDPTLKARSVVNAPY